MPQASSLPPGSSEPGIEHTHGLGVDPDDGLLYAATHLVSCASRTGACIG